MANPLARRAVWARILPVAFLLIAPLSARPAFAQEGPIEQKDIAGPTGSNIFGNEVVVLSNGNFVVTDPLFTHEGKAGAGAVYLYNGATLALISTLTGSQESNFVGGTGIVALANGNFLVRSEEWDNGAIVNAGAVTFVNGVTGVDGEVSADNSLVGTNENMALGDITPLELTSGNYVVAAPHWSNNGAEDAGAVTWGSGLTGVKGEISASNSLVGNVAGDDVGRYEIVPLTNGNYVIPAPDWDNPVAPIPAEGEGGVDTDWGAVIWGDGDTGVKGVISASNALLGGFSDARAGSAGVIALTNGNYVVGSPLWDEGTPDDLGAATWGNGATGIVGLISPANSLIGAQEGDLVGNSIYMLQNGNYVVVTTNWDNGLAFDAGAATLGNGATGTSGVILASNSLVGTQIGDAVGSGGVLALKNGNYVVRSHSWDNGGTEDAGATTWGNGTTGATGVVSTANSLYGSSDFDQVGERASALENGNYVISSPGWDSPTTENVGAVTWANGATGGTGAVSAANSLTGSQLGDTVGSDGVVALSTNNYLVSSSQWKNGPLAATGAVTFADGETGLVGIVSDENSLVGSKTGDLVGGFPITRLTNGNYVVTAPKVDLGGKQDVGAVTWGSGETGVMGAVSATNSLVGSTALDGVGHEVTALTNGNYVANSVSWDNGSIVDAGAITWADGETGIVGEITPENSLVGGSENDLVGEGGVMALADGNYIVASNLWNLPGALAAGGDAASEAGAVTPGNGTGGTVGLVSVENSVTGAFNGSGTSMVFDGAGDPALIVVGIPNEMKVVVTGSPSAGSVIFLPTVSKE